MSRPHAFAIALALTLLIAVPGSSTLGTAQSLPGAAPTPPSQPVRLIFIHHSTGENWLADDNGQLGISLRDNNYFVSDTNYGWGPNGIGDHTDIGDWWTWFRGPDSATYLSALYAESGQHATYSRMAIAPPAGENKVILFKSCFPNSALRGNPGDPVPAIGENPLRGEDSSSEYHTVANAKGIYIDLLEYFRTRQDKLFVVITAPPLSDDTYAANARAFNQWLVNEWLKYYPYGNVAVFDFYNVLTSNGGDPDTNDLGLETGNHHRWWNNAAQHKTNGDNDASPNVLEYPSGDDHPSVAGNLKATGEFQPLLNHFVDPTSRLCLIHISGNKTLNYGQWNQSGTLLETAPLPGGGSSSHAPAAAVFRNRQYLAIKAAAGTGIFIRSSDSNGSSTGWTPLAGYTSTSPSLIVFNDRLYLFIRGATTSSVFYRSMDASGVWSSWASVAGVASAFKPATVVFDDLLYLFWTNGSGRVRYASMNPAESWGASSQVPTGLTNAGPAVVDYDGGIWLVVKNLLGSKIYLTTTATPGTPSTWTAWQWLNGSSASSPSAAVVPETNRLHLAVRGAVATTIWHRYFDPDTSSWSAWESMSAQDPDAITTDTPVLNVYR